LYNTVTGLQPASIICLYNCTFNSIPANAFIIYIGNLCPNIFGENTTPSPPLYSRKRELLHTCPMCNTVLGCPRNSAGTEFCLNFFLLSELALNSAAFRIEDFHLIPRYSIYEIYLCFSRVVHEQVLKGTMSIEFSLSILFIKLLLVPTDTPTKVYYFVKYSWSYSYSYSTPRCIHHREILNFLVFGTGST
jgi:hypothetical protein